MSEPERRKPGRPRIAPETSSISTRIWSAHHDALIKAADQRGVSLSQHVREVLGRSISALKIPKA